jgi:hypothetical protein
MSSESGKLPPKRVKKLFHQYAEGSNVVLGGSASELLADVCSEFVHIVALAGLDRSDKSHRYVDSTGILKALQDIGFPDIVEELPDLSGFSEDFVPL